MSDESIQWLGPRPELDQPILVVMLHGWIDAAGAAKSALDALMNEADLTPIVEFDDDTYVDFRARRPTLELRNGLSSLLNWNRIQLAAGTDQTGRDLLVLSGPEPDMKWHQFTHQIGEIAVGFDVQKMAHLGAYPFAAPHTRPPRLSVSSPSEDVLASVPFLRSSVDVPGGAASALELEMHRRNIPALGIWVQVPHYVSQMNYPAASVALLSGLHEATGLVVDAPELRASTLAHRERIDRLVSNNDEHQRMIEQLEQVYEASDDEVEVDTAGPSMEMLSGDQLAAELEEFLRGQD